MLISVSVHNLIKSTKKVKQNIARHKSMTINSTILIIIEELDQNFKVGDDKIEDEKNFW